MMQFASTSAKIILVPIEAWGGWANLDDRWSWALTGRFHTMHQDWLDSGVNI